MKLRRLSYTSLSPNSKIEWYRCWYKPLPTIRHNGLSDMIWIAVVWIVLCFIVGASTNAPVGCGLFLAPFAGLLAVSVSGYPNLGWLIAGAFFFIPIFAHTRDQERAEKEKQLRIAEEEAKKVEIENKREIQAKINEAYEELKKHPENSEAAQLCRDCE